MHRPVFRYKSRGAGRMETTAPAADAIQRRNAPWLNERRVEMPTRAVARFVVVASAFTVVLAIGAPGLISAAPAGDGGARLGILNLDTQTQIDDLFATEDPSVLSS